MKYISTILTMLFLGIVAAAQTPTPTPVPGSLADVQNRLTRAETRLKDWPQLGRYRDANTKISPPAKGEDRVVFMGDSITDGWKLAEYFPGKAYINRGISGQTTPQMLIRFRPDVVLLKPRVVVILAGTNDLAGNTGPMALDQVEDNLQSMAELAHANGIRIVFSSVLPINDYGKNAQGAPIIRSKERDPDKIKALNEWIKKYAADHKEIYLDYFTAVDDDKGFMKAELTRDGLHPNADGYKVMAPLANEAIRRALKKK